MARATKWKINKGLYGITLNAKSYRARQRLDLQGQPWTLYQVKRGVGQQDWINDFPRFAECVAWVENNA